jgi:exodeoxyribonuclease VII large subunit
LATGQVDYYQPRGQVQLYVRRLEPRGVGALELAFRQLRERLEREGLFDPARKKPLPSLPRRLAVITSPTGAAIRDILTTLQRRCPYVGVVVMPVRVQGEGAAQDIADAVRNVNRWSDRLGGVDVVIIARGGGSLEDLWAFNEEVVARAVFASVIPVISAIGHEVDVTICDLVADLRAATPTAAAELVAPARDDLLAELAERRGQLMRLVRTQLELCRSRLQAVARLEGFRRPLDRVRRIEQRLDELEVRLALVVHRRLDSAYRRMQSATNKLLAVQPAELLAVRREWLESVRRQLDQAVAHRLLRRQQALSDAQRALWQAAPARRVERVKQRVYQLGWRLQRESRHRLASGAQGLDGLARRLHASSHHMVLTRGFSITRSVERDAIITMPGQVRPGQHIETETAGGRFESEVV